MRMASTGNITMNKNLKTFLFIIINSILLMIISVDGTVVIQEFVFLKLPTYVFHIMLLMLLIMPSLRPFRVLQMPLELKVLFGIILVLYKGENGLVSFFIGTYNKVLDLTNVEVVFEN